MSLLSGSYPASLKIDYPEKLNRVSTFFRLLYVIPILIILMLVSGGAAGNSDGALAEEDKEGTTVSTIERRVNGEITKETVTKTIAINDGKKVTTTETVIEGEQPTIVVESQDAPSAGIGTGFTVGTFGIAGALFVATALMIIFRQRYPKWWFDFNLELNRFSMRVGTYLLLLTDRYPSTVEEQSVHLELKYPDAKENLNRWLPLIKWLLALPHYIILIFLAFAVGFATVYAWFIILVTGRYPKGLFEFVVGVQRWGWRVTAYAFLLATDKYPPFSLK